MLNNIFQIIPSHQIKLPVIGLLVASGILGLGVIGNQTKINLKSTAIAADLPGYTNQIQSRENSPLSIQNDIREPNNQVQINSVAPNNLSSQSVTINNISTSTRQLQGKSPVKFPEKDGIYLYGQSPTPNQLGQGYIVFQKHQGRVIGALYMPSSEFSCFQGTLAKSGELAMTVKSSPGESGATQVSTASRIPQVTDEDTITYAYSVTLQDYHQLNSVSANDKQILNACSQDFR
ncbi:hypothetical protein A0J48_017685 [Sphaerospermopsis aphanizomenoides BCCUSP55]|uniref:hypothetical protein n=1 Tax=Sphaerospermopsis aphanizomenoides TaxID=459663 RepID=UPI000A8BA70E|nr:hypothetical protein [Sphaerospermopsis aphanizomenoides]MBK1989344.1 hypothetical protein [Sphaerospermopsis aphanizomenoides BCCUSP55]